MLSLDNLQNDLNTAMRNKDSVRVGVLRMLISELKNAQIDLKANGKELNDEEISKVLSREAKKRRESIDVFQKAGRTDLYESEKAEMSVLEDYLPKQMSQAEVEAIVSKAVSENPGANFGEIMKLVMPQVKGQADGKAVGEAVKKLTS